MNGEEMLTYDTARKVEGQLFKIVLDDLSELDLVLLSVTSPGEGGVVAGRQLRRPFSMIFKGTPGFYCPQRIYRMRNGDLGEFDIFIVPIGFDAATREYSYQAIFS